MNKYTNVRTFLMTAVGFDASIDDYSQCKLMRYMITKLSKCHNSIRTKSDAFGTNDIT